MGPEPKTCRMESVWRELPASVLEIVFTFLPIASLCCFRTLSKECNRSIMSSPTFRHTGAASEEEYALITVRWGRWEGGWVVLDVARKRYFTVSDAFLTKHVQQQARKQSPRSYLAACDGGLFCIRYSFTAKTSGLFVCNPVLQAVRQLPHAAGAGLGETVVMATDRSSMEYEVFIVNTTKEAESILVYESKTGRWRTAPYRPSGYQICWRSLTIFNNNLYCVVDNGLNSYDRETGMVSDLRGIDFPSDSTSHLVVSNGRLFCVVPVGEKVEIFEVDVVKRANTRLSEMPDALLLWVLGRDLKSVLGEVETKIRVAVGSADCILIASVVGRCAAYRLSHNSWYQLPDDSPLLDEHCRGDTWGEIYGDS